MKRVCVSLFELCYGIHETIRYEREEIPRIPHSSAWDVEDDFFQYEEEHV